MGNYTKGATGLALSGGGFRATLFHLGALWRLNEMAILPELQAVSSVSGGALLAGLVAVRWGNLRFKNGVAENFEDEIVVPTLSVCGKTIDIPSILFGIFTGTRTLEGFYERHLVGERQRCRTCPIIRNSFSTPTTSNRDAIGLSQSTECIPGALATWNSRRSR